MPTLTLPFTEENKADAHDQELHQCGLFRTLPQSIQEVTQDNVHLLEYLHMLPIAEVGVPEYYPELDGSLRDLKKPNIIYPVGQGIFSHIYPSRGGERNLYIPIEPLLNTDVSTFIREVERRLLDYTDVLGKSETEEERREALVWCLERICRTEDLSKRGFFRWISGHNNGRISVTPQELEGIKYTMIRDNIGLGILQPLIQDPYIEDISCSGVGTLYLEHKIFKSLQTAITFTDHDELDEFVLRLAERVKKPATYANPIVDAVLPDGSRINIVYGSEVSKRGSNFTIRKFSETPFSILELIEFGTLDYTMAAYLSLMIEDGLNVFVAGETASGKTTLLNAVTTFIPLDAKVVTVEDTAEVQVPHGNWIRELVTQSKNGEESPGVTMFDLLKAALRQRPDEIIVGEIRGEEGQIAFQAMQTGASVMATFHASTVEKLIQRLTGSPINVPKAYVDNLNVVVNMSAVKLPDGKMGRRIVSVSEIVGYDPSSESFSFVEVFRWDPISDRFEFTGNMSSYLLEQKIGPKRGIPSHNKRQIYAQVDRRARILEKLHQQNAKGYYELLEILARASREGLF